MEVIQSIGGIAFGFWFYKIFSHPLKLKKIVPKIRFFKTVEILPSLRIRLKRRILHIHHWIFLSAVFALLLIITSSFSQLLLAKSLCLGGIIQGFTFKDRFTILTKI